MLMYICGGAVMFNRLEGWSLLEGGYFCFTSLGTIGFGDLMPVGRNAASTTLEELSLCACSLYILAGMGLIAMCFNLVQEEVVRVVRVFGRTCGISSGVVVGPIGGSGIPDKGIRWETSSENLPLKSDIERREKKRSRLLCRPSRTSSVTEITIFIIEFNQNPFNDPNRGFCHGKLSSILILH